MVDDGSLLLYKCYTLLRNPGNCPFKASSVLFSIIGQLPVTWKDLTQNRIEQLWANSPFPPERFPSLLFHDLNH